MPKEGGMELMEGGLWERSAGFIFGEGNGDDDDRAD